MLFSSEEGLIHSEEVEQDDRTEMYNSHSSKSARPAFGSPHAAVHFLGA
jgi:hypothetical protein